jgi:hypothetical protein
MVLVGRQLPLGRKALAGFGQGLLLGSATRSRCADVELCGRGDVCRVLRRAGARPLRELYRNRLRHDQATYLQNEITRWGNVIREKGIKGE